MVSKCLAAAASSAARDKEAWGGGETCSLPLSPTCISGALILLEPWVEGCAALVNKLRDEGGNEWIDEEGNEWMVQGTTFLICKVGIVTPRSITPFIPRSPYTHLPS